MKDEARTEELIAFLRDYGEHRMRSRLWDERRSFPPHVVLDLARRGVFGMHVPERFGGAPLPASSAMRVVEQLAAIDTTLASFVGVNEALGARPLARFGSAANQERYLPELARGGMLAGLALTEPAAGSDPRGMRARAERIEGERYRVFGTKSWIGNASWAGVIHVFARIEGDAAGHRGGELAGFTIARDAAGVVQGPEALTMGMRAMVQNEVRLEGAMAEERDRLGGLEALSDILSYGRLGIAAMALGAMERAVQLAHRYAGARTIATGRLIDNPDALDFFAGAVGSIELARAFVRHTSGAIDHGGSVDELLCAAAKVAIPELAWRAVDGAMQRLGGRGYLENSGMPQLFRDVRLFRIFEGPTEALASHLGMRALAGDSIAVRLRALDREGLADFALDRAVEVRERSTALAERRDRMQRAALPLGEWAAYALLGSLSREGSLGASLAALHRARAEERLRAAIEGREARFDRGALEHAMAELRSSIGDVEQRAAEEDRARDPLLARSSER